MIQHFVMDGKALIHHSEGEGLLSHFGVSS